MGSQRKAHKKVPPNAKNKAVKKKEKVFVKYAEQFLRVEYFYVIDTTKSAE